MSFQGSDLTSLLDDVPSFCLVDSLGGLLDESNCDEFGPSSGRSQVQEALWDLEADPSGFEQRVSCAAAGTYEGRTKLAVRLKEIGGTNDLRLIGVEWEDTSDEVRFAVCDGCYDENAEIGSKYVNLIHEIKSAGSGSLVLKFKNIGWGIRQSLSLTSKRVAVCWWFE